MNLMVSVMDISDACLQVAQSEFVVIEEPHVLEADTVPAGTTECSLGVEQTLCCFACWM